MATEELKVVLRRSSDHSSFGFSLLGTKGPPHVIYEIDENSPAADCGSVEAGDIILKVNDIDVHRYTTKEVLKCLRLSDKSVTLDLRRDPKLKAHIKEQLAKAKSPHYQDPESHIIYDYQSGGGGARSPSNASPRHQAGHPSASDSSPLNNTYTVAAAASSASPVSRYKSPSHLPSSRQAGGGIPASPTAGHSRNSSASSAKIQLGDGGALTSPTGSTASPTCRPSRIPTAMKCPPKSALPQPKRARPSQIPTKASLAAAAAAAAAPTTSNGTAAGTAAPDMGGMHSLQHSYSYSGSTTRYQPEPEAGGAVEHESNSAPVQAPPKAPRFEAYMMTGDLILNLSRTPQSSNLLTGYAKKVDSLRDCSTRAAGPRANGALAPRASGESSPTSSSSVESPTHTASSDSVPRQQKGGKGPGQAYRHQQQHRQQQPRSQQERDSVNNSYNSGGGGGGHRKDSLTNDTLLLCEELERDDDDGGEDDDERPDGGRVAYAQGNNRNAAAGERAGSGRGSQWKHSQKYRYHETSYEYYENEDGGEGVEMVEERDEQYDLELGEENEEDQTHYDITNIETYNSGGCLTAADQSDRQRLVGHCEEGEEDDGGGHLDDEEPDDGSPINSYTSASAKQRLRVLKQRAAGRHKRERGDTTDCARGGGGGSSSSSATVRSDGVGGANTSQDETSFSVPTSPISLSTPLIEKETANSMPTSPEPSGLGGAAGGAEAGHGGAGGGVVRRHNGIVRKCDSAGFRTSKSEDHLQQIQREGIAAVIPIDIDEDVNSSLNTLLDTRQDSDNSQGSSRERIVWTYNAPLSQLQLQQLQQQQQQQQHQHHYASHYGNNSSPNSNSHSSSISSSPQHSAGSPASPTSVSSSVMSSSGSKGTAGGSSSGGAGNSNGNSSNGHHHQQHLQQQQQLQANHQQQQQLHLQQQHQLGGNMNGSGPASSGLLQCPSQGGGGGGNPNGGGDLSVSEAISNMSSPDYQDDDNLLSSRDLVGGMTLSDPSDSDSTILVSDAQRQQQQQQPQQPGAPAKQSSTSSEHKLVIQVRGLDIGSSPRSMHSEGLKDSEDEMATLTEDQSTLVIGSGAPSGDGRDSSPPVSDDGSDVESLHSYHYSPKAVDMPSAIRLAKRLYSLDGFKKSDVSRHLSKNNDFSRAVADEFLKYFTFEAKTLDQSLREFLQQFSLSGETQERERVLVHFSKRFLDCNPGTFNSQDAVHTLTCALMLLNTDLHGQNIGRKMSCADFIDNLSELNDGENFPKDVLKHLYQAIKTQPLEWALDDDVLDAQKQRLDNNMGGTGSGSQVLGQNPFLDMPESSTAVEYKKGYVMRKCCYDTNYKKTPFGKRSWKMFYCTLRDLVLFLHKDEHGFRKSQMSDNVHNAIRIHHALATKANDYTKKQHVFRLQTADQAEYLFQTSDSKELQSWVETINFVCAAYSAPPLEGGVGSQKRFQRPLLPSTHTKYLMKEQLESHEKQLAQLENTLSEHRKGPIPSKGLALQNYKEKESFLQYELRRYKTYVAILNAKMLLDQQQQQQQQTELLQQQQLATNEEETDTFPSTGIVVGRTPQQQIQTNNSITTLEMQQPQQQQPAPQQQSTGNRYSHRGGNSSGRSESGQQQDLG